MEYGERNCYVMLDMIYSTSSTKPVTCSKCGFPAKRMVTHLTKGVNTQCNHPDCEEFLNWINEDMPEDLVAFGFCLVCLELKNMIVDQDEEGFRLTVVKRFPLSRNAKSAYKLNKDE